LFIPSKPKLINTLTLIPNTNFIDKKLLFFFHNFIKYIHVGMVIFAYPMQTLILQFHWDANLGFCWLVLNMTSGNIKVIEKMTHIYFHQIKNKKLTFNVYSDLANIRLKKKWPKFIKTSFNFINRKATWKGQMVELVLLKNNAQFFLKKF
jgi:hypothetical protein